MAMTLHQLEVFVEVAQMLNVSRASSALRISQPAVTHQMKALEEEYKITLYHTNGHGIELTDDGRRFLEHARTILMRVKKMDQVFKQEPPIGSSRALTVGACYPATASVLPTIIRDFRDTHPATRFYLHTDTSATLQRLVRNSQLDVALILDHSANDASLFYEPLWREVPLVAVSGDFVLGNGKLTDGDDLVEAPMVVYKDWTLGSVTGQIMKSLEDAGIKTEIVMECSSCEAVRAAVRSGLGMGVFFYDFIAPDLASGTLQLVNIPALRDMEAHFFAVYLKEKPLAPEVGELLAPLRYRRWEKENEERKNVRGSPGSFKLGNGGRL